MIPSGGSSGGSVKKQVKTTNKRSKSEVESIKGYQGGDQRTRSALVSGDVKRWLGAT